MKMPTGRHAAAKRRRPALAFGGSVIAAGTVFGVLAALLPAQPALQNAAMTRPHAVRHATVQPRYDLMAYSRQNAVQAQVAAWHRQQAAELAAARHRAWLHVRHAEHLLHVRVLRERAAAARAAANRPVLAAAAAAPAPAYHGSTAMQACIISRESGGNSQAWNATGHYGLYQFSYGTWVAHGGSPAAFGHAPAAEQNRVFWNTVAADGYSDWSPYDGC